MLDNVIPITWLDAAGQPREYRVVLPQVPGHGGEPALPSISCKSLESAEIIRAGIVRLMDQATVAALTSSLPVGMEWMGGMDFSSDFIKETYNRGRRHGVLIGVVGTIIVLGLVRLFM